MVSATCPKIGSLPEFLEYTDIHSSNLTIVNELSLTPIKKKNEQTSIVKNLYGEFFMFKANTDSYNPVVSHDGKFAITLPTFYTEIFSSPGPTTIEHFHKDPRAFPLMLNHSHPSPIVPPASHPAQIVPPASHPTPIVPPSSQPVSSLFHVPAT